MSLFCAAAESVYYDRSGSGPLADLARYQYAKLRLLQISANQQPLCYPIDDCLDTAVLPPSFVELAPNIRTPYQIQYGLSLDRKVGEKGTVSIGGRMNRGVDVYRSIDINAPLPPYYSSRPDPNASQLRQIQSRVRRSDRRSTSTTADASTSASRVLPGTRGAIMQTTRAAYGGSPKTSKTRMQTGARRIGSSEIISGSTA